MRRQPRFSILFAGMLFCAAAAAAHDTWLLPDHFQVAPGATVSLGLTSGMGFPAPDTAIQPERVLRSVVRLAGGTTSLAAGTREAKRLRLAAELAQPGLAAIGVTLGPKEIELTEAQVAEYLEEIGTPPATVEAWNKMPPPRRWRELYTKHAKTFVRVGAAPADGSFDEPLGLALEIVPQADPGALRAGVDLPVLVLKSGRPFAHFVVELVSEDGQQQRRTTDEAGRAVFRPERAGRLMIRGTEVRRVERPDADWESDFTNLTLEVR